MDRFEVLAYVVDNYMGINNVISISKRLVQLWQQVKDSTYDESPLYCLISLMRSNLTPDQAIELANLASEASKILYFINQGWDDILVED